MKGAFKNTPHPVPAAILFTLTAREADRNSIFRKRKPCRKEVPPHALHAGGCCCPGTKRARKPCTRGVSRGTHTDGCAELPGVCPALARPPGLHPWVGLGSWPHCPGKVAACTKISSSSSSSVLDSLCSLLPNSLEIKVILINGPRIQEFKHQPQGMENPAATVLFFYHEDEPRGTGTPALRVPPAPHGHGLSCVLHQGFVDARADLFGVSDSKH